MGIAIFTTLLGFVLGIVADEKVREEKSKAGKTRLEWVEKDGYWKVTTK